MSLVLSAPGKSFFAGEYGALNGGPAIIMATAPRFELKVRMGAGFLAGIDKDSPAGKLVRKHAPYFNQFDMAFVDPHMGRGGWGASTAQFLMCYALLQWQDTALFEAEKFFDTQKMLLAYKDLSWSGKGLSPSGADLIGQMKGGLTYFEKRRGQITQLRWPFDDLEFYLIPTGQKLPTHEHLRDLKDCHTENLERSTLQIHDGIVHTRKHDVIEGVHKFAKELEERHWVAPKTSEYLKYLAGIPGVLATKGCGALGADVVLALVEKQKSVLFEALLKDAGKAYFSRHHLSSGLDLVVEGEMKIEKYRPEIQL